MPPISLSKQVKEDLNALRNLEKDQASDLINFAFLQIKEGPISRKTLQDASEKLALEVEEVRETMEGLGQLALESARLDISEQELGAAVEEMGFAPDLAQLLVDQCMNHSSPNREVVRSMMPALPEYKSLDWRLDAQIGSRCLVGQVTPHMTLQLQTELDGEIQQHLLQASIEDVESMCREIKTALQESKSNHTRRISRIVK